jgi:WD40 repeat protein
MEYIMFVFKRGVAIAAILVLASSWICNLGPSRAHGQQSPATPQAKQEIDEKTIRALIAQLGDDSFEKREEAEKKLIAVGKPALALLNKAATESKDAEVLDRTANVLKAIRAKPGLGFWIPEANAFDIAFSKDGQSLAVACDDRMVRIYDGKTNALRQTLKGHTAIVYAVAYSPDAKMLASCSGVWSAEFNKSSKPGEIILWDLGKGTAAATLKGSPGGLSSVAFSPDGKKLYSTGGDGTIRLWDLATRTEIKVATGHTKPVRRLSFTPDGKLLASAGFDGTVRFWEPATLEESRQIRAHPNGVGTFTFSPDGKYLLTASRAGSPPTPGEIKVWDMATFTEKTTIKGHKSKVLSLAVSPDSNLLAMGGGLNKEFGEVKIFDLATGAERASFPDHKEWVECVTFSADGNWLASGGGFTRGSPGEIRLWDVKRLVAKGE